MLQDLGVDTYATGKGGNTPMHVVAEVGSLPVLKILPKSLGYSALYDSKNAIGYIPLMMAAYTAKLDVLKSLLEQSVSHAVSDSSGTSLVHLTTSWGSAAVTQVLQDFGVSDNDISDANDTPHPIWQAIHEGRIASAERILNSGLSIEFERGDMNLLQLAAEMDKPSIVRLLL